MTIKTGVSASSRKNLHPFLCIIRPKAVGDSEEEFGAFGEEKLGLTNENP